MGGVAGHGGRDSVEHGGPDTLEIRMNAPSPQNLDHLPYYREYLDQILRPRIVRLIEEVRAGLTAYAWNELLERMAEEQSPGASTDAATIQKMRVLLEGTLGLKVDVSMNAEFSDGGGVRPIAPAPDTVRRADQVDVVDRSGFPDNPLARAVGGIRRTGR